MTLATVLLPVMLMLANAFADIVVADPEQPVQKFLANVRRGANAQFSVLSPRCDPVFGARFLSSLRRGGMWTGLVGPIVDFSC